MHLSCQHMLTDEFISVTAKILLDLLTFLKYLHFYNGEVYAGDK